MEIAVEIVAYPLSDQSPPDSLIWPLTPLGISLLNHLMKLWLKTNISYPQWPWKRIWKLQTLPRIKFFAWILIHNRLPTMQNLFSKELFLRIFVYSAIDTLKLLNISSWIVLPFITFISPTSIISRLLENNSYPVSCLVWVQK